MASVAEVRQPAFLTSAHLHKSIPILPSSAASSAASSSSFSSTHSTLAPPRDPMDYTPSLASAMGPPTLNGAGLERNGSSQNHKPPPHNPELANTSPNGSSAPALAAAAAGQQPKVVQTAFIHKLYNMLEDHTIHHLISWADTNESFVMSPSSEFSKVLSSYFKHTNISSFVRQLNMYGFHKVSDVFHTASPDAPLWEFKHGNGSFKRGDLVGLREIKRRASRHALIHRDSFSTPKPPTGPPAGPSVEPVPDPVESRLAMLEHSLYDMHARMQRSEDHTTQLSQRALVLMEGMVRCHQWNQELANCIAAMVPDPEHAIHKDVALMQRDMHRQMDRLRTWEPPEDTLPPRQPVFLHVDHNNGPPLSPRQMPHDSAPDSRRASLASNPRHTPYKASVPARLAMSPRRFGSVGTGQYSPSPARTTTTTTIQHASTLPPPPSIQLSSPVATDSRVNDLANSTSPPYNMSRRHTSADIRNTPGWPLQLPAGPAPSPFASTQNPFQWPSSPHQMSTPAGSDPQLRATLEAYQLPRATRQPTSGQNTPPTTNDPPPSALAAETGWSLPAARFPFRGIDTPGPPTRRSSMASNVHSLLNPAETAEREDEDEPEEARKRKRIQ